MLYKEEDKKVFDGGRKLPIVEDFYTIQGEGYHTGKPAYFVRIGGCDIGCSWCDTKFSWHPGLHPVLDVDDIVTKILQHPAKAVVVTGGEPLIYDLGYFTGQLKAHGIVTFLETSGAYPLSGQWDWICLSPKLTLHPKKEIYDLAHELKVIVQNENDLSWAEENANKVPDSCMLFLQPEWSKYDQIIQSMVEYVKKNPQWSISLQAHKFMKIP